jgi:predicted N-acyltransferase
MMDSTIEITTTHSTLRGIDQRTGTHAPEASSGRALTVHLPLLKALEDSGSGTGSGTVTLSDRTSGRPDDCLCAGKNHSQGEYMFDHNFAHAFERSGGRYYKLQIAVPFTSHRTVLTVRGLKFRACRRGSAQFKSRPTMICRPFTRHFAPKPALAAGAEMLLHRTSQQYHWYNGYALGRFLAALSSRKTQNTAQGTLTAQAFGGEIIQLTGDQNHSTGTRSGTLPRHWRAQMGQPYLTRKFFDIAHACAMTSCWSLPCGWCPCRRRAEYHRARLTRFIATSGAAPKSPCLHFEICYYQAIDCAIAHGMKSKQARRRTQTRPWLLPATTHIRCTGSAMPARNAVAGYLDARQPLMMKSKFGILRAVQKSK